MGDENNNCDDDRGLACVNGESYGCDENLNGYNRKVVCSGICVDGWNALYFLVFWTKSTWSLHLVIHCDMRPYILMYKIYLIVIVSQQSIIGILMHLKPMAYRMKKSFSKTIAIQVSTERLKENHPNKNFWCEKSERYIEIFCFRFHHR